MVQRGFQLFEDVAVDPRVLAGHDELHLLAELPREVADQAGEPADAVGQRAHPAGQDLVMQPAGEVFTAPGEVLELLHLLAEDLTALARLGLRPVQQLDRDRLIAHAAEESILQRLERGQERPCAPLSVSND